VDPLTISAYGALGIIAIGIGAFFRFGPGKTLGAIADALFGTPTTRDRSGEVMEEGKPGLVHRVATVEEAVLEVRHLIALVTETQESVKDLNRRVGAIEEARIERLINQVESAQMWRAVADEDVIEGEDS
jgi:hypothetical protein